MTHTELTITESRMVVTKGWGWGGKRKSGQEIGDCQRLCRGSDGKLLFKGYKASVL